MKDQSKSNSDIMSVEVNEKLFMDILAQVKLENKRTLPVNNINSASDFINMVSGENCKCQCLCCDTRIVTVPTPATTTTTPTPPKTPTTPTPPTITTPPTLRTTPTTPTQNSRRTKITTEITSTTTEKTFKVSRTRPFVPSTYLPPTKDTTTQRPSTTTRTYHFVPVSMNDFRTWSIPPWTPWTRRSHKVKSSVIITKPPQYAYYAPINQLYYPGEGLKLSDGSKEIYAVTPIPIPSKNLEF